MSFGLAPLMAALEQIIVEGSRPVCQAGRANAPGVVVAAADRVFTTVNAVAGRLRTHTTDVGHMHRGAAGRGGSRTADD